MSYFSKWLHRDGIRSDQSVWRGSFYSACDSFLNLPQHHGAFSFTFFTERFSPSPASYSKYLLMNFVFYLMKCRAYAIHLTHYWLYYYKIIIFWTGPPHQRMRLLFESGLAEIRLRTEKELNLTLPAIIIICLFGFPFVSQESVCQSNLRAKNWL